MKVSWLCAFGTWYLVTDESNSKNKRNTSKPFKRINKNMNYKDDNIFKGLMCINYWTGKDTYSRDTGPEWQEVSRHHPTPSHTRELSVFCCCFSTLFFFLSGDDKVKKKGEEDVCVCVCEREKDEDEEQQHSLMQMKYNHRYYYSMQIHQNNVLKTHVS